MSVHSFSYMGIPVEYTLIRKKIKNINIRINEKCLITVSAPQKTPLNAITGFVESKAEWIIRNTAEIERYNLSKPDNMIYRGKKVYFLGNQYTIEILNGNKNNVFIDGGKINIVSEFNDTERLKKQYLKFLEDKAQSVFSEILYKTYAEMKQEGIPRPDMTIRNMKTRWGSCNVRTNKITLNLQLIKADAKCIRQVAAHELTHFIVRGHNDRFYAVLEKYVPDWKKLKKIIDTHYKDGI